MTTISYEWVNKETGEVRTTKSWPEVLEWVENEGGEYKQVIDEHASVEEGYCMPGAASANQRWKNYKF